MRLASVVLSLVLVGALSGTSFAQAPRASTLFLFPMADATSPAPLTKEDIKQMLNDAQVKSEDHPFRTDCTVPSYTCTPNSVFISAAAISTINIDGIPDSAKELTVRITAGETDANGESLFVRRTYAKPLPDHIQIAIHKARGVRQTFGTDPTRSPTSLKSFAERLSDGPRTEEQHQHYSDDPAIGFISRGISDALSIELQLDKGPIKTIKVTLNYQRWFVDMGGFLTFSSVADEELATQDDAPGMVKILKKRHKSKLVPGTGLVLDFHPANYPSLAAQFGIATSVDRNASYYLGFGYRLRELGPNTLATFAAGISATQVKRFPDVKVGDIRSATSTAVTQGSNRYAFGPYLSLSLGFAFGGMESPSPPSKGQPAK
jgi:hypothetical protein